MSTNIKVKTESWPELPYEAWKDTCETVHMWTQIVGKIRMTLSPQLNQWWHVPLYITANGLSTSCIPYPNGQFEINFDFISHNLVIQTSEGTSKILPLISRPVAQFYQELMASLHAMGIEVQINTLPQEVPSPIRFEEDQTHATYDPAYAGRFWQILVQVDKVLKLYRSNFIGKSSLIQFFWGSFDLSLAFFSGRRAPERPGADAITKKAYAEEEVSCGFWPGSASFPYPAFYSYTAPAPAGIEYAQVRPEAAYYDTKLGEFILRYDDVRVASDPAQTLLDFFKSTYDAGANLAHWNRQALEQQPIQP